MIKLIPYKTAANNLKLLGIGFYYFMTFSLDVTDKYLNINILFRYVLSLLWCYLIPIIDYELFWF